PELIVLTLSSFSFHDTATTSIYTLSLHDALPISLPEREGIPTLTGWVSCFTADRTREDPECLTSAPQAFYLSARPAARMFFDEGIRKSTRLNSSHVKISYAVFCLKKKKTTACSRK